MLNCCKCLQINRTFLSGCHSVRTAQRSPGSGPTPTLDLGLWTLDFGHWTLDFRLWTACQVRAPSSGSGPIPTQNRKRPRTMRPAQIPISFQIVHRSSLRWCCNSTAVNRRFKSAKPPAQSNLKRRFVERPDFVGVVCDKNSMNVSTCFCAKTGKVSYLAINVSLLITNHAAPNRQSSQSGILRKGKSARLLHHDAEELFNASPFYKVNST